MNEMLEMETLQKELDQANARIQNLEERLKLSYQMDAIRESQDLLTLKNEIHTQLRTEYTDWVGAKSNEMSEDEHIARGATINRIFKTLKRLGIKF